MVRWNSFIDILYNDEKSASGLTSIMPTRIGAFIVTILFLPLVSGAIAGTNLSVRFQFPPAFRHSILPGFSVPIFSAYSALSATVVVILIGALCCRPWHTERVESQTAGPSRSIRWWGWTGLIGLGLGLALGAAGSFSIGFFVDFTAIALLADGLSFRRQGSSLIANRPAHFVGLFAAGAVLWWILEYLNRFAEVWYFTETGSPWWYGFSTTLSFAPVVPAILALRLWLIGLPGLLTWLRRGHPLPAMRRENAALLLFLAAATGLMGGAVWQPLFGLLWLAPVLLLTALQLVWVHESFFSGIFLGDWSRVATAAAAGICFGFLLAVVNTLFGGAWRMDLPFVDCCRFLNVPLFGYLGFAVLGVLSVQISDLVAGLLPGRRRGGPRKRRPFPVPVRTE